MDSYRLSISYGKDIESGIWDLEISPDFCRIKQRNKQKYIATKRNLAKTSRTNIRVFHIVLMSHNTDFKTLGFGF